MDGAYCHYCRKYQCECLPLAGLPEIPDDPDLVYPTLEEFI